MNIGKIGSGGALGALGAYIAGMPYGLGLVFMGVVIVLFGVTIIGYEEFQNRK